MRVPREEGPLELAVQALEAREERKAPRGGAGMGKGVDERGLTAEERMAWASISRGW